jgi:hypothetical protein
VDQGTSYVKAETEQPQNQENYKNRPKHVFLLKAKCPISFICASALTDDANRTVERNKFLPNHHLSDGVGA